MITNPYTNLTRIKAVLKTKENAVCNSYLHHLSENGKRNLKLPNITTDQIENEIAAVVNITIQFKVIHCQCIWKKNELQNRFDL